MEVVVVVCPLPLHSAGDFKPRGSLFAAFRVEWGEAKETISSELN